MNDQGQKKERRNTNAPDPEPVAYSPATAARAVGISRTLLYDEWKAGTGPDVVKIGSRTLITPAALSRWLQAREQKVTRPSAA